MSDTALITGSSGGIGEALCTVFRKKGFRVIGLDIKVRTDVCDDFIETDLRRLCADPQYRNDALTRIRRAVGNEGLKVLINNAAVQILKSTEDILVEDWVATMNVNVIAPFILAQALLPELEKVKGSVVNIASVHAVATKPEFVCYATSKHALVGLTKSMAVDLGPRVRVNAICPAAVSTPMLMAGFEGKGKQFEELSRMHPIGRIAKPEEIANVAAFLASSDASFITGATINADGGIASRLHDPV